MRNFHKRYSVVVLLLIMALLVGCSTNEDSLTQTTEATGAIEPVKVERSTPDLAEHVQNRTVTITVQTESGKNTGSGFFIDGEGTVVTSYHVIDAAESIAVEISDGAQYEVTSIVDFNELYDVAVLKLDVSGNDYLEICQEKSRTGETVYAVGSSLGFLNGTFSDGIVSNASRKVGLIDCVQTTAAISSGNSGGPLVNTYGEVIGINAFSYRAGENLNLAVQISTLDMLSMDKNWDISRYREWYNKEIARSYKVWNYSTESWEPSKINTYQHVTGEKCFGSCSNWELTDLVEGYLDNYGIFCYKYDVKEFDQYTEYLNSVGFAFMESEDFTNGTSYYYENEFTGYYVDIFVVKGDEYILIEPYCGA